jgi:O-antigen/teichoic acid export membrane protein
VVYYLISASSFYVTSAFNIFFLKKHVKISFSRPNLKAHLMPLIIILSSTLAVSVYLLMDNIILGFIKNDTAVGIYSTAIRIVKIPFTIIVAISSVIVPQVSQAFHDGDVEKIRLLIHKSFSFICLCGIPIAVGIFISSAFLVHKFAGDRFSDAIIPVRILSPVILLVGLNNILGFQILTPIGKEKYLLSAVAIGMCFSLILNIILIPFFSYMGAAITNLLTECVVTLVCYLFVGRFIKIWFNIKIALQCAVGASFFFPIAYTIRSLHLNYNVTEICVIITCTVFYGLYINFFIKNEYVINFKQAVFNKVLSITNS